MDKFSLRPVCILSLGTLLPIANLAAQPTVTTARAMAGFKFEGIATPAINDAAEKALLHLVDGRRDTNGAKLPVLTDGRIPAGDDDPGANFFFAAGTDGGRLRLDLAEPTAIAGIATYSWHRSSRAPQVYSVWGSTGDTDGFQAAPKRGIDPGKVGWTQLAEVDTRQKSKGAGSQHAALIRNGDGTSLGTYRHLLFDLRRTEDSDPFGNTFLSEIDVIDAKAPAPERYKPPKLIVKTYTSKDKVFQYTVNATKAPEFVPWVEKALIPAVETWYPRMVAMMPSKDYTAPRTVYMEFKDDMGGTPAYAAGNRVSLSIPFFKNQLGRKDQGEAKGCVIPARGPVIQNFGRARRTNPSPSRTPGWVTEGLADYVRWFLFEPEKQGARITRRNLGSARHDASYRISANFIDWVVREYDEDLLRKLNAVAREGQYQEPLWKTWTGKSLDDLATLWLESHRKQLGLEH